MIQRPQARHCVARSASFLALWFPLVLVGCGAGQDVELTSPRRGEIRESFTEPARTRLAKTYRISMPVSGLVSRIDLEPGDPVKANQELAKFDLVPFREALAEAEAAVAELESRITLNQYDAIEKTALIETKSTIEATAQALKASDAQVEAEEARAARAAKELGRVTKLAASDAITQSKLDDANLTADTSLIELRRQQFYRAALNALFTAVKLGPKYIEQYLGRKGLDRQILQHQLAQARSRLARAEHDLKLAAIRSPIDGVVLERFEQGDRALTAGHELLLLGNLAELEVIADVLTQDAMRLSIGSDVRMETAARLAAVSGKVKRIEPAGFTKLSSLGVEQQRVNVIVSLDAQHDGLGVGYRVQAEFLTGAKPNALIVPRFSVLQAPDQSFYVLGVVERRIKKQPVKIGLRSDLELEVLSGLSQGDVIVAKPDTTMAEGMKVSGNLPSSTK